MKRGPPAKVNTHGHPTAQEAVRAFLIENGGATPRQIAERLRWPMPAVLNALNRLAAQRQATRNPLTKVWA
jgi:Mn-dependent DtxR family transcriptional regulator